MVLAHIFVQKDRVLYPISFAYLPLVTIFRCVCARLRFDQIDYVIFTRIVDVSRYDSLRLFLFENIKISF